MTTLLEWSTLVRTGTPDQVRAALLSGQVTASVANSSFDFADECSGMLDDPNAWVRRPALVYAVSAGARDLLRVLLESDLVDPNQKSPEDGQAAVNRAAGMNTTKNAAGCIVFSGEYGYCPDILHELLKHPRVDVNNQNDDGSTPLHNAAWTGNVVSATAILARPELDIGLRETSCPSKPTALMVCSAADDDPAQVLSARVKKWEDLVVDREAVADLIRAESARRARVTRAARLFMLWRRVNGQHDTAATAATTGATAALLGKGEFVFGPRCPYDLVSKILCYAAGTPLDDEIRELAGAAVSQEQLLGAQHPLLRSAQQGAPPPRTTNAAPHLLTQAALAAMSTQKLLLRLQVEKEKSARLRREQIGLEDEQRVLEESIRACSLVRGVAASSPSPSPAARHHGTGDLWVDQTLPPHVVAAAEVEVEAMIEGRL
jgi:hypothetical protein